MGPGRAFNAIRYVAVPSSMSEYLPNLAASLHASTTHDDPPADEFVLHPRQLRRWGVRNRNLSVFVDLDDGQSRGFLEDSLR
jgi:hypothetical protein